MTHQRYCIVASPVGDLLLAGDDRGLCRLEFQSGPRPVKPQSNWHQDHAFFRRASDQLKAYFASELRVFDLPLAPVGTPFQMLVWRSLQSIPYAQTRSYGQIARQIGKPSAVRAVGAANGRNPIAIIIPCHRVIGADGSLTGFGGGLHIKQSLLQLEHAAAGTGQADMAPDWNRVSTKPAMRKF